MKLKYYHTAALAILALSSCNEDEFLYEAPELKQSTEITLGSIDGIKKAVAGAYSPLSAAAWYGSDFITNCELRACNARKPIDNKWDSGRCKPGYDWSYTSSSTMSGLWSFAYYTIANANEILDNVDGKADEQTVNGIKAEALFLRAISHFDLVRTFGQPYTQVDPTTSLGVPVMLHATNGTPARNTVAEVYEQIEADLLEAEKLMPDDYNTEGTYHQVVADYKAVASKEAIQALLSRVYLYMGKWQAAADYATKVINSGKFGLWNEEELTTVYNLNVASPKSGEVIFEVYGDQGNYLFSDQNWEFLMWISSPRGSGDFGAAHDVYDLYSDEDARKKLFVTDPDAGTQYWTTKYAGKDNSSPSYNNTILIRLSEMYLNRAEAQIKGATVDGATAQSDMAAVANARGVAPEAVTERGVFTERRKELAFEGHIIYDFARFGYSLKREDTNATLKEIPFPNYRWAMPIPKSEIDANPNMVQNPNY
ncbi:MAG: RagB/SusD family nutrient uptake outer membrane protein [Bacteroidales bacterium]|nr:RagB/SusD family nutrient uptake outer membrane protein [Bacteroidales bacterium]